MRKEKLRRSASFDRVKVPLKPMHRSKTAKFVRKNSYKNKMHKIHVELAAIDDDYETRSV